MEDKVEAPDDKSAVFRSRRANLDECQWPWAQCIGNPPVCWGCGRSSHMRGSRVGAPRHQWGRRDTHAGGVAPVRQRSRSRAAAHQTSPRPSGAAAHPPGLPVLPETAEGAPAAPQPRTDVAPLGRCVATHECGCGLSQETAQGGAAAARLHARLDSACPVASAGVPAAAQWARGRQHTAAMAAGARGGRVPRSHPAHPQAAQGAAGIALRGPPVRQRVADRRDAGARRRLRQHGRAQAVPPCVHLWAPWCRDRRRRRQE